MCRSLAMYWHRADGPVVLKRLWNKSEWILCRKGFKLTASLCWAEKVTPWRSTKVHQWMLLLVLLLMLITPTTELVMISIVLMPRITLHLLTFIQLVKVSVLVLKGHLCNQEGWIDVGRIRIFTNPPTNVSSFVWVATCTDVDLFLKELLHGYLVYFRMCLIGERCEPSLGSWEILYCCACPYWLNVNIYYLPYIHILEST